MSDKYWSRLLLDVATNVRSMHDGVSRMPFNYREDQKYPEYLDDIGALCACIRVFQDSLSPISQNMAMHPYEKIYRDPISMPDLLTTSISDQMKEEIKASETIVKELEETEDFDPSCFKNMDQRQICHRINEFNNSIVNISQTISDMDFTQLSSSDNVPNRDKSS
ncbi:hypothetical protein OIY81_2399 [Cryptosporidium canis]|uniref:Mediator of RNA polymerase II transcription subunit 21 n=1 Tax=Cryptosporidium canis TaxID=195482 RepID=A0ABQ8P4H1_9CRYT|nr:hypothetical protein OJ252_3021 [Cryptosporidium canis]KAJ1609280.1 hypothetical protein OIY81_2399 [Cryptosporidium canis]